MESQQASPGSTFSEKLSNGGGFTGKHVYDGVFGGPVKSRSPMEDYREIFGGSATCSIPILDFPELKERSSPMEARIQKPDYSMIFGGFKEEDFAVPYEELFSKPKRVKNSSQEARAPVEAWTRPPVPKHSNFSEQKQSRSPEVSFQSFDEVEQFNVSYNKSHPGGKNGTDGTTHIAQLHAVPGYACLIDEVATQKETNDDGKPIQTTLNDANISEGIKASKPVRKVASGPQPRTLTRNTSNSYTSNPEVQRKSRTKSFSNDISFDTFEIGLGTQPLTMSPNIGSDKGEFRSVNSKFGVFGNDDSKDVAGSHSPPYLDEEMDTNSAAAAVRKAIEEAQLKIKIAKESMERRKQGLQSRAKSSSDNGLKAERRETKVAEKANRTKEKAQKMHPKDCPSKPVFNGLPEYYAKKESKVMQDFRNVDSSREAENGKATKGFSEPAGIVRDKETASEVHREINLEKMKPFANESECKEKKFEVLEEVSKQEKFQMQLNSVEAAFQWDIFRHSVKSVEEPYQLDENNQNVRIAFENDEAPQVNCERLCEPEETAKFMVQDLEEHKDIEESREGQYQLENEKIQREADNQKEMENQLHEVPVREENEKGLAEVYSHRATVRGPKEDLDGAQCKKKQPEDCLQEENEKRQNCVPKPNDTTNLMQVHTLGESGVEINHFQDKEEREKRQKENCETKSEANLKEAKENEGMLKEDYQISETERHSDYEDVESERLKTETQGTFRYQENNLETDNHAFKLDVNEKEGKADEAHGEKEAFGGAEANAEVEILETERMSEGSFPEETEKESAAVEEADDWLGKENIETGHTEEVPVGLDDGSKKQIADLYPGESDLNLDHKHHVTYEKFCEHINHFEEVSSQSDENDKYVSDSEIGLNDEESESDLSSNEGTQLGKGMESESLSDPENLVDEVCGLGLSQEEGEEKEQVSQEETQMCESRQPEDNLQKEVKLGRKHLERKQESKIREMEKEKERLAVERAILEAHERAFAEARERAVRAALERAAAAGAHGKLEKVNSEANGMPTAEKGSMEAKLKAERAAVERATAEARERALEKAMSEKASFKMRNQAEKSATEKFSGGSRDSGIKTSDQHSKGSGPSSSSKYQSFPNNDERFSGDNGESTERFKATFERNQRTAERAAKALAEKNMRDLLAQKEQAERNRLAEILDADVKRWSSGKERNLRALLSTLQYILGSDSGWQPIPLTGLISTAAVKKAYRKATLFVHPDKLQQRGASIQQKYTCEKVFDLLKDAWNKFNSEER